MAACKHPMSSEVVLLSYAPLVVGVHGSLCFLSWYSNGGSRLYLRRPFMLSRHPVKTIFSSNLTSATYLSSVNVHPVSHEGSRPSRFFTRPVSLVDFLA